MDKGAPGRPNQSNNVVFGCLFGLIVVCITIVAVAFILTR